MAGCLDTEAVCALLADLTTQWVEDAQIDLARYNSPRSIMEADYRRRKARYDFECAKDDPEGYPLLGALSAMTGRREVEILDVLLRRAGIPWDIQPDVLADGPRLRLWDALGIEEVEQEQEAA
jgi:hypothetical protein